MQAAGLSNSPSLKQNALLADLVSPRHAGFETALAQSIADGPLVTSHNDAFEKKLTGKRDPKLEADNSFLVDHAPLDFPLMAANPLPVLLMVSPRPVPEPPAALPAAKQSDSPAEPRSLVTSPVTSGSPLLWPNSSPVATAASTTAQPMPADSPLTRPTTLPQVSPQSVAHEDVSRALPTQENQPPPANRNAPVTAAAPKDSRIAAAVPTAELVVAASASVTTRGVAPVLVTRRNTFPMPQAALAKAPDREPSPAQGPVSNTDKTPLSVSRQAPFSTVNQTVSQRVFTSRTSNAQDKTGQETSKAPPPTFAAIPRNSIATTAEEVPLAITTPSAIVAAPGFLATIARLSATAKLLVSAEKITPEPSIQKSVRPSTAPAGPTSFSSPSDAPTSVPPPQVSAPGAVSVDAVAEFAQQPSAAAAPAVRPKSDSPLPALRDPAGTPLADPTPIVAVSGPVVSATAVVPPPPATPLEAIPMESAAATLIASVTAPVPNNAATRPDKVKPGPPAPGLDDIRSAASRAAQVHGPLFVENMFAENRAAIAVPHAPAGAATVNLKDVPEKKPSGQVAPGTPLAHDTQDVSVRNDGSPLVVPREPPPPAQPASSGARSETRAAPPALPPPDSAPAAENRLPLAHVIADAGADQQMRVGIRTAAFGAVEIYTSVHQNQVGITVHGERSMAHWFSSEVQNLESGLKDHQLHLTTMVMDKSGSALQTSTGSHQQNPQRNFQATRGWPSHAPPERDEKEIAEATPVQLPSWSGENRVSIRI